MRFRALFGNDDGRQRGSIIGKSRSDGTPRPHRRGLRLRGALPLPFSRTGTGPKLTCLGVATDSGPACTDLARVTQRGTSGAAEDISRVLTWRYGNRKVGNSRSTCSTTTSSPYLRGTWQVPVDGGAARAQLRSDEAAASRSLAPTVRAADQRQVATSRPP